MKKYRIKKVTDDEGTRYFPQKKVLWWWNNLIFASPCNGDGGFGTLGEARKRLCEYCREPVVEYLNFDPIEDCK
jgi:hypothetical protein